jgi:hypothetical protein
MMPFQSLIACVSRGFAALDLTLAPAEAAAIAQALAAVQDGPSTLAGLLATQISRLQPAPLCA